MSDEIKDAAGVVFDPTKHRMARATGKPILRKDGTFMPRAFVPRALAQPVEPEPAPAKIDPLEEVLPEAPESPSEAPVPPVPAPAEGEPAPPNQGSPSETPPPRLSGAALAASAGMMSEKLLIGLLGPDLALEAAERDEMAAAWAATIERMSPGGVTLEPWQQLVLVHVGVVLARVDRPSVMERLKGLWAKITG